MAAHGRTPSLLRVLRLMAALSLIVALAAVATIVNGDSAARSELLIAAAIILGSCALLGMALAALPFIRRKKEQNDARS
jgi:hypothetical protein